MKLIDAVRDLWSFAESDALYAREPWTADSETIVAPATKEQGRALYERGYVGVLPVDVAREFLYGWFENVQQRPSLEEQCARLIHYGIYDA